MILVRAIAAIMTCAAVTAVAQVRPQPGEGDPRIQLVDYRADQVVRLEAAPGFQVTVELAPDEQIQTVAVGDTAAWQVTANRAGDRLFVKPAQSGNPTNMLVVTTSRSYNFELIGSNSSAAYTVRFRYPLDVSPATIATGPAKGVYRLSGDRKLWPVGIHDDGTKTYIDWSADVALPAVYVIDPLGREVLANGYMRDSIYVIDGVERRLLFRIDRHTAQATRYQPRSKG